MKRLPSISLILFLCSCGQQTYEPAIGNAGHSSLPDSVKLDQYFQWSEKIEYINAYKYDQSFLSRTEENRDTIFLLNFLTSNYDNIKYDDEFSIPPNELVSSTYAIDINGDSLLDIIYDGPTGGEQSITHFFLNEGDHYEKIFSGYQHLILADLSNGTLNSFVLINTGCCADPQIAEYYYSVTYSGLTPTFNLDKTIGYLGATEKLKKSFDTPKAFDVKTDHARLRTDCYILDNVEHPVYGSNGNSIATFKSGSKGKALGMKSDKGVEWIYAIMDSGNELESCEFPTFKEQPTEIRGWILREAIEWK